MDETRGYGENEYLTRLVDYAGWLGVDASIVSNSKVKLNGRTYTVSDAHYTDPNRQTVMKLKISGRYYTMWSYGYQRSSSESNTIYGF